MTDDDDVLVRPAAEQDLDFLVWVMVTAATSHLDRCVWSTLFDLDDAATASLLRAVAVSERTHWCHLDRFLVAEVDGRPAAAATRFDPATEGNDALTEVVLGELAVTGVDDAALGGILERAAVLDAATPKDYADSWGIENVAVRPGHRGRGLVERLFATGLAEGRDMGREHAQILCLVGNDRAQRAWERNGFDLRADYRSASCDAVFGSPGLKLLAQSL